MLNNLENDPRHANAFLEEDKFYDANSSHDQLTRLALTIEPDGDVPGIIDDPVNLLRELRGRVDEIEDASREIQREIRHLKEGFQVMPSANLAANLGHLIGLFSWEKFCWGTKMWENRDEESKSLKLYYIPSRIGMYENVIWQISCGKTLYGNSYFKIIKIDIMVYIEWVTFIFDRVEILDKNVEYFTGKLIFCN